jgi:hypothetical protein
MSWVSRWCRDDGSRAADEQAAQELLDDYHPRASVREGDRIMIAPHRSMENIAFAMERIDNDINTSVSLEEDVITVDELEVLIGNMRLGPTLAVHVVNNAMRIMAARYPADLVHNPLPPDYDLRVMGPLMMDDHVHEIAKDIFNLRTVGQLDLTENDIAGKLRDLDVPEQMTVFAALYMYGTKVGALKHRTGIELRRPAGRRSAGRRVASTAREVDGRVKTQLQVVRHPSRVSNKCSIRSSLLAHGRCYVSGHR